MTIKELLAKVLKDETLTDDEKKVVQEFDPDAIAAAARRKAEADAKKLVDKLTEYEAKITELTEAAQKAGEAGKGEADKFAKQVETLTKQVETLTKAKEAADREAARLGREQRIGKIRAKHGVKFVDGVDPALVDGAFARAFDGLDDFDDETEVTARVEKFKAANKALVADSGHGAGTPPGTVPAEARKKEIEGMSDAQRAEDMRKKGLV